MDANTPTLPIFILESDQDTGDIKLRAWSEKANGFRPDDPPAQVAIAAEDGPDVFVDVEAAYMQAIVLFVRKEFPPEPEA